MTLKYVVDFNEDLLFRRKPVNSKQIKKLKKLIKPIQVEWLQTLLPEESCKNITEDNVKDYLPEDQHTFGDGQVHLSYMSDDYVLKHLKNNPKIKSFNDLVLHTNKD
jgi:hypothetical protein